VLNGIVAFFSMIVGAYFCLLLLSTFGSSFDVVEQMFKLQLQYSSYQMATTSREWIALQALQQSHNCCGISGPGDYTESSPVVSWLVGSDVAPNWILEHDFAIDKPKPVPTSLIPTVTTPPGTGELPRDKDGSRVVDYAAGDVPTINCSSCTINLHQPPAPTTPVTYSPTTTTLDPRNRRTGTPPWPYGTKGWPWFMGPPPKNNECNDPNPRKCVAARFRRESKIKLVDFQNVRLIVPDDVKFGKHPVPDSCCVDKSKYCGLQNDFWRPTPVVVNYTGTDSVPGFRHQFNISNFNSTIPPPTTRPKPAYVENIFVHGCYSGLGDVLAKLESKLLFQIAIVFLILDFFLMFLFSVLLCSNCPTKATTTGRNASRSGLSRGYRNTTAYPISQIL